MKHIKFRGLSMADNKMEFGYYMYYKYTDTHKLRWAEQLEQGCDIDGKTIGQSTGIYDKNSQEIYIGDIVHCPFDGDEVSIYSVGVVGYHKHFTGRIICHYIKDHYPSEYGFDDLGRGELEVLGNIHQNPELLTNTKLGQ